MTYVYQEQTYPSFNSPPYPQQPQPQPGIFGGSTPYPNPPPYSPPYPYNQSQNQPTGIIITTVMTDEQYVMRRRRQQKIACFVFTLITVIMIICILRFLVFRHH